MELSRSPDILVRGILQDIDVRFAACRLSESAREACERHSLQGGAARMLSEALAGCALLGSILREGEKVSLQVRSAGPLKSLLADVDDEGHVRGAISTDGEASYEALARSSGILLLSRTTPSGLSHQGYCQLSLGHLPSDLALHCSLSEQIETFMDVLYLPEGSGSRGTGGLLLQALPQADPMAFESLRRSLETRELQIREDFLEDPGQGTMRLLSGFSPRILLEKEISFACNCSRARVSSIIQSLGREEIKSLIDEFSGADVTCHWCGRQYHLDEAELLALLTSFSIN